jgi:putative transposase
MEPEKRLRKGAHTTSELWYHLVWIPKYRKAILTGAVAERTREILLELCQKYGYDPDRLAVEPDHVPTFLSAPPRCSPASIAQNLKGPSGQQLLAEFPPLREELRWGKWWGRGYFVSPVSEGRLTAAIRAYLDRQGRPRLASKQLRLPF